MSADPRNTDNGGWIHEEEFREMIQELIEQEAQQDKRGGAGFEDFVKPVEEEARIKTVLESVEDLFSCNLSSSPGDTSGTAALEGAIVDEMSIPRANDADSAYDSDEDTAREIALTQAALKKTDVGHDTNDGETREEDMDEMRPDGAAYAAAFDDPEDRTKPPRKDFAGHSNPLNSLGSFDNGMVDDATLIQSEIETFHEGNVAADQRAAKRPRFDRSNQQHSMPTMRGQSPSKQTSANRVAVKDSRFDQTPPRGSQQSDGLGPSSQSSIKAHGLGGLGKLGFSVVKNAHNPDTRQRLSQPSQKSSSQQSLKTPAKPASLSARS